MTDVARPLEPPGRDDDAAAAAAAHLGYADEEEEEDIVTEMQEEEVPQMVGEEEEVAGGPLSPDGEMPVLPPPQPMTQPMTPEEVEPPIPEPVHHEEVKQSPVSSPLHLTPTPPHIIQHVSLPPGAVPPPIVPAPPKLTPHEISLITEAASKPGPNGTFQCTLCNKQFGYKNGLIRHIRLTHVGEKPYECNICHRRFGYKHILMEHQNLHYGHRPYACTMCDKKFAARSNLIQHRTVHKRPYNCHLCNKRFDKEDQLKKHLFAHPQALIHCTLCKFAAANQAELNKHIMEAHASVVQEGLIKKNGEGVSPPHLSPRGDRQTEPITPPSVTGSPQDLSNQQSMSEMHSPTQVLMPRSSKGHRIDAICNQLSTSIASGGDERVFHPGIIIKKEGGEEMLNGEGLVRVHSSEAFYPVSTLSVSGMDLPRASMAALYTTPQLPAGISQEDINRAMEEANKSLPGIQEMFSRRTPNVPMSLPNYGMALAANSGLPPGHTELPPALLMSPPPTSTFPGGMPMAHRPVAPPPNPQDLGNGKRDQAVQHTAPIPGFPSLEDVLAYYMGQGKLFKCQHCDVMFFERGMYFLHASLHGHSSPWECSICHKICADKNEFTIHFVNQQHNA